MLRTVWIISTANKFLLRLEFVQTLNWIKQRPQGTRQWLFMALSTQLRFSKKGLKSLWRGIFIILKSWKLRNAAPFANERFKHYSLRLFLLETNTTEFVLAPFSSLRKKVLRYIDSHAGGNAVSSWVSGFRIFTDLQVLLKNCDLRWFYWKYSKLYSIDKSNRSVFNPCLWNSTL